MAIASGRIHLKKVSDGYSVSMTSNSCIITSNSNGDLANLQDAYTDIYLYLGPNKTDFNLTGINVVSGVGVTYRIENLSDKGKRLRVMSVPRNAVSAVLSFTVKSRGFSSLHTFYLSVVKEGADYSWLKEWDNNKTLIGGEYIASPKMFVGTKTPATSQDISSLSGVYIGRNGSSSGVYGYKEGQIVFHIDNNGAALGGWVIHSDKIASSNGKIELASSGEIRAKNDVGELVWKIDYEGNGSFAKGNVVWDKSGNVSIKGRIDSSAGRIGGWSIEESKLSSSNIYIDSSNNSISVSPSSLPDISANGGVKLYYNSTQEYGIVGYTKKGEGLATLAFSVGSINKIAGWEFDDEAMWIGSKAISDSYTPSPGHITIGKTGVKGNKWFLGSDGSGALAGGKIYWDAEGNINFSGDLKIGINNIEEDARQRIENRTILKAGSSFAYKRELQNNVSSLKNMILHRVLQKDFDEQKEKIAENSSQILLLPDSITQSVIREHINPLTNRIEGAESLIRQKAEEITFIVKSTVEEAVGGPTFTEFIDATELDHNKFYPVLIRLSGRGRSKIGISRPLSANYNPNQDNHGPIYSSHSTDGFSLILEWSVNSSGWGSIDIERRVTAYKKGWLKTGELVVGSFNHFRQKSAEVVFVRGGSAYDIKVTNHAYYDPNPSIPGSTHKPIELYSEGFTYEQNIKDNPYYGSTEEYRRREYGDIDFSVRNNVTEPIQDVDEAKKHLESKITQKSNEIRLEILSSKNGLKQEIESSFEINSEGINMLGKKIVLKGNVFLNEAIANYINVQKASIGTLLSSYITAQRIQVEKSGVEMALIDAENGIVRFGAETVIGEGANIGNWKVKGGRIVSHGDSIELNSNESIITLTSNMSGGEHSTITNMGAIVKLDAQRGLVRVDAKNQPSYSTGTAYMSSTGIFANLAGTRCLPSSTGYDVRGAIVGVGFGNLDKSSFNWMPWDTNLVVGVYGRASNKGSAPSFGGYFENLYVSGITLSVEDVKNNGATIKRETSIAIIWQNGTYYLPDDPVIGSCVYVTTKARYWGGAANRVWRPSEVTIRGRDKEVINRNGRWGQYTFNGELIVMVMFFYDGTYWNAVATP